MRGREGKRMQDKNEFVIEFDSKSQNESFARTVVAAFVAQLDPVLEELADIKTSVSEAVTNCIIHGYENKPGKIKMGCKMENKQVTITVEDSGVGIADIEKAMEPLFTTKPELERSGMGFSFMETFMDEVLVESTPNVGTKVTMKKRIGIADAGLLGRSDHCKCGDA